jgi:hypothetical protein
VNDTNIITLYHGSISIIDSIDTSKGKPYKLPSQFFFGSPRATKALQLVERTLIK